MLSNGWTVCECEWEGVSTSPCIVARPSICTRGNNAPPNDCSFHSAHLIRDDYLYFIGTYDVSAFWGSPVARLAIPLESTPRRRRRRCEAAVCERNPWLSALYQKALAFLASDACMHAFPSQKQSNIWRTPACARKKAIRITVMRFDADNINIENNVCIVWDINFDFIWLFSICSHFFFVCLLFLYLLRNAIWCSVEYLKAKRDIWHVSAEFDDSSQNLAQPSKLIFYPICAFALSAVFYVFIFFLNHRIVRHPHIVPSDSI